jgi:hypothetical protein
MSENIVQRRACRLVRQHRGILFYRSRMDPRTGLRARMREIAQTRVRYRYRRIHVLLRREGWTGGKNLICRLYCEEQLQFRSKRPRRRKMPVVRRQAPVRSHIRPPARASQFSDDCVEVDLPDLSNLPSRAELDFLEELRKPAQNSGTEGEPQ